MSVQEDDEKGLGRTMLGDDSRVEEESEHVQLMVAMQPTTEVAEVQVGDSSMIEVQEVVVVTDVDGEGGIDFKTAADISSGHLVPVGAVEEIEEIINASKFSRPLGDNKEPVGPSKRRPSISSSDTATEESDDDMLEYTSRNKRPKKREFAHRLQWRGRDMMDALKAVETKKMTIRGAAKKFCVPYSTLKDRVHGRVRHGTKPGVKTILSPEEEDELVRYIRDMETSGFQMRHVDVRDRAGELLRLNHGHNTPYKEGSPGHNWLGGFLKRHPGLEFRRTLQRNMIPSAAKQKQMLRRFYDVGQQIFKKHRLHHKSDRIFVVSEFRVRLTQHATVLVAASADGMVLPPFVVFHGQKLKLSSARQAFPDAFFTCSFNGFINDDIFLWWFRDHFLKKIPYVGNRPLVLFLSRPVTDISLQLAQRAKEERVFLVAIPPQVHHLVTPLDEELAVQVETMMTKKANKWHQQNENFPFTQRVFAEILRKVWSKGITAEEVTRKFSQNGLFPLSSSAISADRILNATQSLREAQQRASTAVSVKQDPLAGLSLLSALSSHEYASLGHMYSNDTMNRSFEGVEEDESPERVSPRRSKRRRHEEEEEGEEEEEEDEEEDDSAVMKLKMEAEESPPKKKFKVSEELVKHVLEPTSRKPRAPANKPPAPAAPHVQDEIVAARENIEQINRAIDSILEKAAQDEALKQRQQTRQAAMPLMAMRSDSDAASHLLESVKAEHKTEPVLTEEQVVVEEQVVEEQIVETNTVPLDEPYHEVIEEAEVELGQDEDIDVKDMSSVEQLVQNKRTILVETVMVNGQKVKIVRMAPATQSPFAHPAPGPVAPKRTRVTRNPPKVTILRTARPISQSSHAQVVINPMDMVFDEVPQHQVLEETVEQEVEVSNPELEAVEMQYTVEEGEELVTTEQSYVPQELSRVQVVQEGVPAQIFEQDEGSIQVQELDPEIVMDEQVILQPGEQEILEDENGVQYVQVFNSETGQHEHIVLEHQVV